MRRFILSSALALSVIAVGLSTTAPAHATLWRNFKSPSFYLTPAYVNSGAPVRIHTFTSSIADFWWELPDNAHPGFNTFTFPNGSGANPPPGFLLVMGVSGNIMKAGTPLILWGQTGELNQDWRLDYTFNDSQQAACYILYDGNSPPNHVYVAGVAGGVMAQDQPVVIWDYFADPVAHGDQFWCKYALSGNAIVPE